MPAEKIFSPGSGMGDIIKCWNIVGLASSLSLSTASISQVCGGDPAGRVVVTVLTGTLLIKNSGLLFTGGCMFTVTFKVSESGRLQASSYAMMPTWKAPPPFTGGHLSKQISKVLVLPFISIPPL